MTFKNVSAITSVLLLSHFVGAAVAKAEYRELNVVVLHDDQSSNASEILRGVLDPTNTGTIHLNTISSRFADDLDFAENDVLVLNGIRSLDHTLVGRLEEFVVQGGGLLVVPSAQIDVTNYNELLFRDGCGLLPAKLDGLIADGATLDIGQHWHPSFSRLTSRLKFSKAFALRSIDDRRSQPTSVFRTGLICPDTDERPFLIERQFGKGRCLLTSAAWFEGAQTDSSRTDAPFQTSRFFEPIVRTTIEHAAGWHPTSVPNWNGDANWELHRNSWRRDRFQPVTGRFDATVVGPVKFDGQAPHALMFDGNSKRGHRLNVATDPDNAPLPQRTMTVDAWVKVNSSLKWGGFVGFLQDNGNYERGWTLGFANDQFLFGVATRSTNRMTYLKSRQHFHFGHWYYVAATYDGRTMRLFVDGELVGESNEQRGHINYPPQADYTIGAYKDKDELHSLNGQMSRVCVRDHVVSADVIRQTFETETTRHPESQIERSNVVDWPTYQRDNVRSGRSTDAFPGRLARSWTYQAALPPAPAWPPPADQDFWHRKQNLRPRVVYDRALAVVSSGGRVFFGSAADDQLRCLDLETGKQLWSFFAEGPIRLAPTVFEDLCLFGSDDGCIYCVSCETGQLVWKQRVNLQDRRIPGNERVISAWPLRTGVLVEDDIAFCCAGIFPNQGVTQAAFDVRTGKELARGKIDVSAQGYLERRHGKLFVATGRDPAGGFIKTLARRGKPLGREVRSIPDDYPFSFISVGDVRIGGGDGRVAAFHAFDGRKVWSDSVRGKAYSLAYARDRLLVSTDQGEITCFTASESDETDPVPVAAKQSISDFVKVVKRVSGGGAETPTTPTQKTVRQSIDPDSPNAKLVEAIVNATSIKHVDRLIEQRGYALVEGSTDVRFIQELAQRSGWKVVLLADDETSAGAIRRELADSSIYGQVVVHVRDGEKNELPYTDYMFNVVVDVRSNAARVEIAESELIRILRPQTGTLIRITRTDDFTLDVTRRPKLQQVGEWTHLYGNPQNTVCSLDAHVQGAMQMQWFGRPGPSQMMDRHHRPMGPLSKNGRLYIPGNNRVIAADAYNGAALWNVEVPDSRRAAIYRDSGYIAVTDDAVYVASGSHCIALDAAEGFTRLRSGVPIEDTTKSYEWGHLSVVDDIVFGSATKHGGIRRSHSLLQIHEGTYFDFRPLVCSDFLFARDRHTGRLLWQHDPFSGVIINSTISHGDGKLFFIESMNQDTLAGLGRQPLHEMLQRGARVVAINEKTGIEEWSHPIGLSRLQHTIYTCFGNGKLVVTGSHNEHQDKKNASVLYDVLAFDGACGAMQWSRTQRQGTKINGDHGEQDHHPVIVNSRLICEPFAYDIDTGEPIADWAWQPSHRRGCGTISASASSLFFRHSNPTMFDITGGKYSKVTTSTRPGCWINMIPANGLLLVPEASSGCTCNYPVQTSLAFLPTGKPVDNQSTPDQDDGRLKR